MKDNANRFSNVETHLAAALFEDATLDGFRGPVTEQTLEDHARDAVGWWEIHGVAGVVIDRWIEAVRWDEILEDIRAFSDAQGVKP